MTWEWIIIIVMNIILAVIGSKVRLVSKKTKEMIDKITEIVEDGRITKKELEEVKRVIKSFRNPGSQEKGE
jgi:hypothetical protein